MNHISITEFRIIKRHPYVRALASLNYFGLKLRGLRLEQSRNGELTLGFPGRKIQGHWQIVYQAEEPEVLESLKSQVISHYNATLGRSAA